MKKFIKWMGIAVLVPILLFFLLAALLYLPPVQNWVAKQITTFVSDKTGMDISVGFVRLEWPLDLGIDDFQAIKRGEPNDTIADLRHLSADVQLWPLFHSKIVINELALNEGKINTNGFISDLRVSGWVDDLWLASRGIDLERETVEVNGARLSGAQLHIELSDTAAVDTTQSQTKWRINADSLSISQSEISVSLPGDTVHVQTYLGHVVAHEANMDLGDGIYKVKSFDWNDGRLFYGQRSEKEPKDSYASSISLKDITLGIDSISYTPQGTSFFIRQTAMKMSMGQATGGKTDNAKTPRILEITNIVGGVRLDSAFNQLQMPLLTLHTPNSDIETEACLDFNVADSVNPGQMKIRLNAQLGKPDLLFFMGDMPQKFVERFPNHPLTIKGSVNGNLRQLEFTGLDISLPTALHATATGTAENLSDLKHLKANVSLSAQAQNIDFITAAYPLPATVRIPRGISVEGKVQADGPRYEANLTAHESEGTVRLKGNATIPLDSRGNMNIEAVDYDADIAISKLNLKHFLPQDSLRILTTTIKAKGHGTDILNNRNHLNANIQLQQLEYGHWDLSNLTAQATLRQGHGILNLQGDNKLFSGTVAADALLNSKNITATISADKVQADLYQMRLVESPLSIGLSGKMDVSTDQKLTHRLIGRFSDLTLNDGKTTYHPKDVGLLLKTSPDTTVVRAQSGDFIVKFDASGDYERLIRQLTTLSDSAMAQFKNKVIDQPAIKRLLPTMKIHVESLQENPVANILKTRNIEFKELLLDMTTSPQSGINGQGYLYSLNMDSTLIDTVRLNLTQRGDRLSYQAQVRNNRRNPQFVFNALMDGHFHQHGALAGLRYYDDQGRLGVRVGATAEMEDGGIRMHLMPERPTIGYKEFNLNKDNFIFLAAQKDLAIGRIQAKVDLIADDKTGVKLYTENQDSTMLQDLTVSVNRLDLGELTSVIPYLPRITGKLNGDYHILQDRNQNISVASDMAIQQMTFEGSPIGNLSTELVYLMKEDDTHAIEARLMLDDEEFGLLKGTYTAAAPGTKSQNHVEATFTMTRFPLSIANGFVPEQLIGLEGFAEGSLTIKGSTTRPKVDGELYVEDAFFISQPYGIRMRFDNDPVRIVGSHLLLENFGLYAHNEEPLIMMGDIDFSNTERITMDMRMRARNLLLINSKQTPKSVAFGKGYVNFAARMNGPLDQLNMRGRLDVLSSTDMTYMLLDSPLSTDNRLEELVKFTDFSDTTQTVVTRPVPTGLTMDMTVSVSQGAHIVCNLNTEQSNYVDLMGGGDLRMHYNSDGLSLNGRYTLSNGQMKYSLPVIPLKTFTIKDGSYVEFTGDPMNPRLNITATERQHASVNTDGNSRSVLFDCGVVITKTLNNMGLQFVIEAPEDMSVNSELQAMSAEERGKLAVTMLTTGMYLADGNTDAFSMNAALSSFLENEINNITGSTFKNIDLSVGVDQRTSSSGNTQTDYSFRFSKRLWNNRLNIQLGGKVSTGNDDNGNGARQSFFDNVTMEYRLDANAQKNIKLFYQQNVYDWLDGYTGIFGGGFVWRRKLDNFWDIFRFWRKEDPARQMLMPREMNRLTPMSRDSLKQTSAPLDILRTDTLQNLRP